MTKNTHVKLFGKELKLSWTELIMGGALIVPGLVLLIWPTLVPELILIGLGVLAILAGAALALKYFFQDAMSAGFSNALAVGLVMIGAGVLLIVLRKPLISVIPLLCGLVLLLGGISKLQAALNLRRTNAQGWKLQLGGTIISIILGVIIILNPFSTAKALMRILGAALLFEGIQDIIARNAYKSARSQAVIETSFKE